jgi:hypothetical protein
VGRFQSLAYSPPEARRILRARFRRNLPTERLSAVQSRPNSVLTDESILRLLLDLNIEFDSELQRAQRSYATLLLTHPDAPSFDNLAPGGWIAVVWGRVQAGFVTDLRHASAGTTAAVRALLAVRDERRVSVGASGRADASLATTIAELEASSRDIAYLVCPSPAWVVARLWERAPASLALTARLRFWLDRCELLPDCYFAPSKVWDGRAADEFRNGAFHVLQSEGGLLGWEEFRQRAIARATLQTGRSESEVRAQLGELPSTLVDRYLWTNRRGWEHVNDHHDTCGELWRLVNFLLRDIENADQSAAPHPVARELFQLAVERPALLDFLALSILEQPVLLADMLLEPRVSALACLLVARWPSASGAWDRELTARDDRSARQTAFADAMAAVAHFAAAGSLAPNEIASLLTWLQAQAYAGPYASQEPLVDEQMFAVVHSDLASLSDEVLSAIVAACLSARPQAHVGTPHFDAALDVASLCNLAESIDPGELVTAYVNSFASLGDSLSARRVATAGAIALVQLAMRGSPARRRIFFSPLDVRALLAKGEQPGANRYVTDDEVARALRVHIRVMARAISAWNEGAPAELVDALVRAVHSGALVHREKGRVGALSVRYETGFGGQQDRSIAIDLGEALVALDDQSRERLLSAILETDEPAVLADLYLVAPFATRDRILARVNGLHHEEAGEVWSLTDVQVRIEKLMAAGAVDAASRAIEVEQKLETLGAVRGRQLTRLRTEMRVRLLRNDFDGIAHATLPDGLGEAEAVEANDILTFYRSLAELTRPGGAVDAAAEEFERLYIRRRDIVAYGVNLLAARVSQLLAGNLFGVLRGDAAGRARRALAAATDATAHWRSISADERAIHDCNRSLLLLATGRPAQAHEVLGGVGASELQDRVSAYAAVALARMGRRSQAMDALDKAQKLFGDTEILRSARAQISHDEPLVARAGTTSVDDPVPRIKAALWDFSLMDPRHQAEVLGSTPNAFDGVVLEHVRAAAGAVVELVSMMTTIVLDSCEDDLTAVVAAILAARLGFLQWSLPDQSRGGFTAKGNPGERDLVIRKGTNTLAVIEAVVCRRSASQAWTKGELKSHFQKLFSYSNCGLYFLLTYAYTQDQAAVLNELRRIAEKEAPFGFTFERREDLPWTDSRPPGFSATYATELGHAKVVFLLLDMEQSAQRGAARQAAESNPRAGRTKAKAGGKKTAKAERKKTV